jgi:23S rRNA pseudouridine2605 synthase
MSEQEDLLGVLLGAGAGSRRKIAAAIMQGRVMLNGVEATGLRQPVDSRRDTITVDGVEIRLQKEKHVYLVMNKPVDVLSTVSDDRGRKTVMDFIPEKYRQYRLYPAGRLDRDTTGLLLLTNDGDLTNRLTHPRFEHEKEYHVVPGRELINDDIRKIESGIELFDGVTSPAKISKIDGMPDFTYSLIIHEGRKRQVRRMFTALGCRVVSLKRVRLGGLKLGDLKEGEVQEIPGKEIRKYLT